MLVDSAEKNLLKTDELTPEQIRQKVQQVLDKIEKVAPLEEELLKKLTFDDENISIEQLKQLFPIGVRYFENLPLPVIDLIIEILFEVYNISINSPLSDNSKKITSVSEEYAIGDGLKGPHYLIFRNENQLTGEAEYRVTQITWQHSIFPSTTGPLMKVAFDFLEYLDSQKTEYKTNKYLFFGLATTIYPNELKSHLRLIKRSVDSYIKYIRKIDKKNLILFLPFAAGKNNEHMRDVFQFSINALTFRRFSITFMNSITDALEKTREQMNKGIEIKTTAYKDIEQ